MLVARRSDRFIPCAHRWGGSGFAHLPIGGQDGVRKTTLSVVAGKSERLEVIPFGRTDSLAQSQHKGG